jgi:hypothetical protein
MMLVGQEERALWASAVVTALGQKMNTMNLDCEGFADRSAKMADAIVLEFRKRDGSRA